MSDRPSRSRATSPAEPVNPADPEVRAQMKQWLDQWARVAPILEAERLENLRALDEAEAGRISRELVWPLGTLGDHRGGDDGAGLIPVIEALRRLGNRT